MPTSETDHADLVAFAQDAIRSMTGTSFRLTRLEMQHGGNTHACYRADSGNESLFIKIGERACADMFAAEADGLEALRSSSPFRVPALIGRHADGKHACLTMEYMDLSPLSSTTDAELVGEALAILHANQENRYGWDKNTFLGLTPLENAWHAQWSGFFARQRFAPLLAQANADDHDELARKGRQLIERIPALFVEDKPPSCLLHGDLWHGNIGVGPDGTPVLFDPAVFYGDPEFDLALTSLFGGFPSSFYTAYRRSMPPRPGYEIRDRLYRCYQLLNHYTLFGRPYLRETIRHIDWLLAYSSS